MKNIIGTEIGQNSNNKRYYDAEFAEKMGLPVKVILALKQSSYTRNKSYMKGEVQWSQKYIAIIENIHIK